MSFYLINLWQCSFPLTSVPVCPRLFICFRSGATQSLWRYSLIWIVSMTYPNLEKASRHQEVHDKYPDIKSPRFWSEHTSYTEVVIGGTCLGSFSDVQWNIFTYFELWYRRFIGIYTFDIVLSFLLTDVVGTIQVLQCWFQICDGSVFVKKKSNNSFDAVANKIS